MNGRILTPNSAIQPRRMVSNGQRIEDLEKRCQMLEYNLMQLAKALSTDLERLLNEQGALASRMDGIGADRDASAARESGQGFRETTSDAAQA